MSDEKINDLIEKFREIKESKGFTDGQIAKLSGYTTINRIIVWGARTKMSVKRKLTIIAAAIFFLLLTIVIYIVYNVHKSKFIASYPDDNRISVCITCVVDLIEEYGSVGNEWGYEHFLNSQEFKSGEILTIGAKDSFSIASRITEYDDISDIGKTVEYYTYDNYKKPLVISQYVRVVESGGKRYVGSFADFNVVYTLERVMPADMRVWDVYLYTSNVLEYITCILFVVGQLICVVVIILNIIKKKEDR